MQNLNHLEVELIKTDDKKASNMQRNFLIRKDDIDKEIPKFSANYKLAQKLARMGFDKEKICL